MSQLHVKGKVLYTPGPWGPAVPVPGAHVEVIDVDAPGMGDDLLLTVDTDPSGNFQGITAEWQDTIQIKSPFLPHTTITGPDPTDVLALQVHVTENGHEARLPLVYVNDTVPSPPVVVPWGPLSVTVLRPVLCVVNHQECYTPEEANARIIEAVNAGVEPILIELRGPEVEFFSVLRRSRDELWAWIRANLHLPPQLPASNFTGGEIFLILLGVTLVILAIAFTIMAIAISTGLVYAIMKGYDDIQASQAFNLPNGGGSTSTLTLRKGHLL